MSLIIIGTVAFDAIETPFGKTDKIVGGAATYASLAASYFSLQTSLVAGAMVYYFEATSTHLQSHQASGFACETLML